MSAPEMTAVATEHRNEVTLVGRVSMAGERQTMPSGDQLVKLRVVVERPRNPRDRQPVDALDCVVWLRRLSTTVMRWNAGDVVEVRGRLRRRFYDSPAGRVSRCEVEVTGAKLIRRADG